MNGRRAIVGLTLLCALVFAAFAAPNAMAALKGTTAYTCVKEDNPPEQAKGFEDEHCLKATSGDAVKWVHEEIGLTTTLLTVENDETSKAVPAKLVFSVEGTEVELEAQTFFSCGGHTSVQNKQNGEKMEVLSPEFCGEFSEVSVKKAAGCVVKGGIVLLPNAGGERGTAKGIVIENAKKEEEMYVEFKPAEGKPFATFTVEKCEKAGLNKTYKVEGTAKANVSVNAATDGPTLKFTAAQTGPTLKVVSGELKTEGKFSGTFTARMAFETGKPKNPVTLTTTP
jgi:hypothetical protein